MSRAREVVEVIGQELTDYPDDVVVTETERADGTHVELTAAVGDLGKLIGRQGRTAAAVRTLAIAAGELEGLRVNVDFSDKRE